MRTEKRQIGMLILSIIVGLMLLSCQKEQASNNPEQAHEPEGTEAVFRQHETGNQIEENIPVDVPETEGWQTASAPENNANAYAFENQEYCFRAYYPELQNPPFVFSFINGTFYMDIPELDLLKLENAENIKGTITAEYRIETTNGYTYVYTNGQKFLVLNYQSIICVLIDCSNNDTFLGLNKNSKYVSLKNQNGYNNYVGFIGSAWSRPSSYLVETINGEEIAYKGTGAKYYYQITRPWVEGVEGYGIGEWIDNAPMASNIEEILFFNGYIDPNRPDLYYANSRVKEVLVTNGDMNWTFTLEDTPNPQILRLPQVMTGDLRFIIKDVYEGTKYMDTCIAGIYYLGVRGRT